MKSLLVIAFMLILFGECNAQHKYQPVFPYSDYTWQQIQDSIVGDSPRAEQLRNYLLELTGEINLENVFAKSYLVDTILQENSYQNSGWDPKKDELAFYPGKYYKGPVGVYQDVVKKIFCKGKCINAIAPPLPKEEVAQLEKGDEPANGGSYAYFYDTIHHVTYVFDTIVEQTVRYYGDGTTYVYYPLAEPYYCSSWINWGPPMWFSCGAEFFQYHPCEIVNNYNTTIINNNTNNIFTWNNRPPTPTRGGPAPNPGNPPGGDPRGNPGNPPDGSPRGDPGNQGGNPRGNPGNGTKAMANRTKPTIEDRTQRTPPARDYSSVSRQGTGGQIVTRKPIIEDRTIAGNNYRNSSSAQQQRSSGTSNIPQARNGYANNAPVERTKFSVPSARHGSPDLVTNQANRSNRTDEVYNNPQRSGSNSASRSTGNSYSPQQRSSGSGNNYSPSSGARSGSGYNPQPSRSSGGGSGSYSASRSIGNSGGGSRNISGGGGSFSPRSGGGGGSRSGGYSGGGARTH